MNLRYRALRARSENEEFRIEKVLGWSVGAPKPLLSKFLILNSKLERSRASALVPFLSHYVRHLSPFWGKRAANEKLSFSFNREKSKSSERSEEHTSELQSRGHLVCRLLLEK